MIIVTDKELLESISYLIDEDLDEYVKRAPVHNGKKVLSERAWEALWDTYFHEYERKEIMSVQESREYEEETRKFGDMYECCI